MQKKFISNLALLLLLNLLIKPFWLLGIDREVQNVVGVEGYGMYFVLFNFTFLFQIILDLGITNFNNRNIAQNEQLLNKHLSGITVLKAALGILYLAVTMGVGLFTGYSSTWFWMLLLLSVNQFLLSFIQYLRSNLAGLQLYQLNSYLSVVDRGLMILFCGALLWGNLTEAPFQIEWFVYCQTASYLIAAVITFLLVLLRSGKIQVQFRPLFALSIVRQSLPYALLILLMTFYSRVDVVMLELLLPNGSIQAGYYAHAYRLLDAANIIGFLFASLLLPMFSRMLKTGEDTGSLTGLSVRLLIAPSIALGLLAATFAEPIMALLYRDGSTNSGQLFTFLMFSFIPICSTYIYGTLLTANGSLRLLNYMAAGGVLLNILLNAILIPSMEALGAALASLITQAITAVAQILLAQFIFRLSIRWKLIGTVLLFGTGSAAICWAATQLPIGWQMQLGAAVLTIAILAFITKVIDLKALRSIVQQDSTEKN